MLNRIAIPQQDITTYCEAHHIERLMLFGSVLREDFSSESDIDVLVEFEGEHVPGFLGFSAIQRELSLLLNREVDLHTPQSLSRYFRDEVIQSAQVIYEKDA